jgi:hypothetical protein
MRDIPHFFSPPKKKNRRPHRGPMNRQVTEIMKSKIVPGRWTGFLGQVLVPPHDLGARMGMSSCLTRRPSCATNAGASRRLEIWWDGPKLIWENGTQALAGGCWWSFNLAGVLGFKSSVTHALETSGRLLDFTYFSPFPRRVWGDGDTPRRSLLDLPRFGSITCNSYHLQTHLWTHLGMKRGETGAHPDAKDAFSIEIATDCGTGIRGSGKRRPRERLSLRSAMVWGWGSYLSCFPALRRLAAFRLGTAPWQGRTSVTSRGFHESDFCRAIDLADGSTKSIIGRGEI